MKQSLKYALAATALFAAAGTYAATDDGTNDRARLDKDAATLHMEPQVIITEPAVSMAAPAPAAAADSAGAYAEPGVVTQYNSVTYYAVPSTPSASLTLDDHGQMDSYLP
ncbi:MAG TPA: hypothetical protein VGN52_17705 [Burkholderiales bacterium]|jgi:hypothetical protein